MDRLTRFAARGAFHLFSFGLAAHIATAPAVPGQRSQESSVADMDKGVQQEQIEWGEWHVLGEQFTIALPKAWYVHDQMASIGRPGRYGVVVFSPVDIAKVNAELNQGKRDETARTMVAIATGEIPSFFVDRVPTEKGMTCDKGYTEKARKKVLEGFQASARRQSNKGMVAAPQAESVSVGGCQGLRVKLHATTSAGDTWDFLVYAIADGETHYAFTLRNRTSFFEKNVPVFEKAISTLVLGARHGQ